MKDIYKRMSKTIDVQNNRCSMEHTVTLPRTWHPSKIDEMTRTKLTREAAKILPACDNMLSYSVHIYAVG